jgi:hypothetical protein
LMSVFTFFFSTIRDACNTHLSEDHLVLGKSTSLITHNIRDLSEFLCQG